jgi:hypothetical protein
MRLFSRACESRQTAYLAAADRLAPRERIALEMHAASCADCADALRNGRPMDVALRSAFAPLRDRRTIVAPGRVRLVVGSPAIRDDRWVRVPRFFGRLTEVSVMVGVTLFAVGSSLGPSTTQSPTGAVTQSVVQAYFRAQPPIDDIEYLRWLRLGRADGSATASDITRLPMGGRFDGEPIEIQKGSGAAPR